MTDDSESKTKHLLSLDEKHSWHPFTQMQEYLSLPRIQIQRGQGSWLWDTDGNPYLDASASIWTNVHGHNHPDLNAALIKQLSEVAHSTMLGVTHPVASQLAEKLVSLCPQNITRCFYSDNGSNAVEIALKMSFQYWQLKGQFEKTGVIGLTDAYHGDTFGTMSVGDCGAFHSRFQPWFFPSIKLPRPNCLEVNHQILHEDSETSIHRLSQILEENSHNIACLIIEPLVQGSAGMQFHPKEYLQKVAELCKKNNVHLIVDEVFVGFGRLGSICISEKEGIHPDFICFAKGLTAGYVPLAATMASEEIYQQFLGEFSDLKALFHGHTFTGNPLGCAVALENIRLLEKFIKSQNLENNISFFANEFQRTTQNLNCAKNFRQRGMIAAFDLHPPNKPNQNFPTNLRVGIQVAIEARKHKILIRPLGDSILVVPPINIEKSEISTLFENLILSINETLAVL